MKESKKSKAGLANAIIWASMIIASSLLSGDQPQGQTMTLLLIAGWFTSQNLMPGSEGAARSECAMIRRILGRSKPSS